MTTPPIPPAMIEAAARRRCERDCGSAVWAAFSDDEREDMLRDERHEVADTLAAAFEVCEVQPRFRVHWVAKNGDPEDDLFSGDYDTVERAQEHVAAFDERDRRREHEAVIEQSLEIFTPVTSPAEQVDTEGATT